MVSNDFVSQGGKKVKIIIKGIQEAGLEPEMTPSVVLRGKWRGHRVSSRRRARRDRGQRGKRRGGEGGWAGELQFPETPLKGCSSYAGVKSRVLTKRLYLVVCPFMPLPIILIGYVSALDTCQ